MFLNDLYLEERHVLEMSAAKIYSDGKEEKETASLLSEHLLEIYINEELTFRLACTPTCLSELVMGRLLSEGIIRKADDVSYLSICRYGKTAEVYLSDRNGTVTTSDAPDKETVSSHESNSSQESDSPFVEETQTCCTDNHVLNRNFVREDLLPEIRPLDWKPEWIFSCAAVFREDTPLHKKTRSTHSCFLCRNGEILFTAEDIGRHNAMDKAIGHALLHDIPLGECYLYTSGRVPTDMMRKIVYAGVPLLISKEYPTTDAAELASQHGITLIGKARPESFLVF